MKKIIVTALSLVIAMGFVIMVPQDASAVSSYMVTFTAEGNHVLSADGGHLKIDGQYVDLKNGNNNIGSVTVTDNKNATITVTDGMPGKLNYNAGTQFTLYNGEQPFNMDTEISSDITLTVKNYVAPETDYQNIHFKWTFEDTKGEVVINDKRVVDEETAGGEADVVKAGYTDPDKTNKIKITTSFGEYKASWIKINDQTYEFTDAADQHEIEVQGADTYNITVHGDPNLGRDTTVIWANPDCKQLVENDMKITHGYAYIVAGYDRDGNEVPMSSYTQDGTVGGVKNGFGWASPKPGSRVVFRFTPEYGYQLTSVAINERKLSPQDTINQYEFTMPEGFNLHFSATFTPVTDVVDPASAKVTSGRINLGNTLEGGTATLTVNDVQLSADKIQGFQNAAGAYNVSQYLDIDLYNVFYKGKNDASDAWENKIDELPNEATISLRLADGVNANDIVLVHNIHDGENFEIIPVDSYDPATNTITFKTKSFSNYAIATKDGKKGGSKGPGTGDDNNIIPDLVIMITAGLALAGIGLKRRFDR